MANRSRGRSRVQLRKHLFQSGRRRAPPFTERLRIFGSLNTCKSPGLAQITHLRCVMRRGSTEKEQGALSPIEIIALQDRAGRSVEFFRCVRFGYSFMRIPKCFGSIERTRLRIFEPLSRVGFEEISDAIVFVR